MIKPFLSTFFSNLSTRIFSRRFERWLNKRMPANNKQQLTRNNIFILPSRFGLLYILLTLLIFILGTNYQNNIIILLSYLLGSLFLSAMFRCFYNLSGLTFSQEVDVSGYNKQLLFIPVTLKSKSTRYALCLQFSKQEELFIDEVISGVSDLRIPFFPSLRGQQNTGRLKVSSEYSLGLFTCWTHLDLNCCLTIYPQVKALSFKRIPNRNIDHEQNDAGIFEIPGVEDFSELKTYKRGESLSQVAWKQVAKGQGWLTKHYVETKSDNVVLKLQDMPSVNIEWQLSYLCFLVGEQHKLGHVFSLELGSSQIEAGQGQQHFQQCLYALACYPKAAL